MNVRRAHAALAQAKRRMVNTTPTGWQRQGRSSGRRRRRACTPSLTAPQAGHLAAAAAPSASSTTAVAWPPTRRTTNPDATGTTYRLLDGTRRTSARHGPAPQRTAGEPFLRQHGHEHPEDVAVVLVAHEQAVGDHVRSSRLPIRRYRLRRPLGARGGPPVKPPVVPPRRGTLPLRFGRHAPRA
jgi:hypothetical protein